MSSCELFAAEAKNVFTNYQPIRTEIEGVANVVVGLAGVAFSSIWRLFESHDLGTGTPIPTQFIEIYGCGLALGLVKLSFPIIITTGVLVAKYTP